MFRILKKLLCVFLSLLMIYSLSAVAFSADVDTVVDAAVKLIISNEGVYTSVLSNDNGAVSIGKVGWHATRALDLLKTIVNDNPNQAKTILGDALFDEIRSSTNWNTRIFTSSEKSAVEKLLATPQSHAAQDKLARNDIASYITHGMSLGISDGKALVYFADMENQMGSYGSERVAKAAASASGGFSKITLDNIYKAALADKTAGSSPTRRKNTYNYCKGLNFDGVEIDDLYSTGTYIITASSLRIRSGPSTSYDTVASAIPSGTKVTVTEVSGEWGKIKYNGSTGWICLLYADFTDNVSLDRPRIGDVDGNGRIEASDARLALRYSAKLQTLTAEQQKRADIEGDGRVTASDARLILRKAAKLD